VLLGGLFGGLAGQENKALAAFDKAQNDDINAQKFAYQAGLDQATGKATAFKQMTERFGDPQAAENAVRAAQLDTEIASARLRKANAGTVEEQNANTKYMQGLNDRKTKFQMDGLAFQQARQGGTRYAVTDSRGHTIMVDEATRNRMFESGLKQEGDYAQDTLKGGIDLQKASIEHTGKGAKEQAEQERYISSKLSDKGIPQARAAAEGAISAILANPRGFSERVYRGALPAEAANAVSSNKSNIREGAYSTFTNAALKVQMGNVTGGEWNRAIPQFALAATSNDVERLAAARRALDMLDAEEKVIRGGVDAEKQRTFDERSRNAVPSGIKPGAGVSAFKPKGP